MARGSSVRMGPEPSRKKIVLSAWLKAIHAALGARHCGVRQVHRTFGYFWLIPASCRAWARGIAAFAGSKVHWALDYSGSPLGFDMRRAVLRSMGQFHQVVGHVLAGFARPFHQTAGKGGQLRR